MTMPSGLSRLHLVTFVMVSERVDPKVTQALAAAEAAEPATRNLTICARREIGEALQIAARDGSVDALLRAERCADSILRTTGQGG